jgi:bifunctional aspartokinase / homoserine dehydrogenase 1
VSSLPPTQSRESVVAGARKSGRTFLLYTSTIGASVPVVDTLGHILKTGDRVQRIHTSLSGSMGFVTNEIMQGKPLSEAVRGALQHGFCERDPREDLSGLDMAAKIIVLARALGAKLSLSEIQIEPLVPAPVLDAIAWSRDMSIDDIVESIQAYDETFHQQFYAKAVATHTRLRFVATIDLTAFPQIAARIAPQLVDEEHAAYFATHDEIAFGFHTNEYQPRPLVLKGSGTGATASATGVLRDVLTIAKSIHGQV